MWVRSVVAIHGLSVQDCAPPVAPAFHNPPPAPYPSQPPACLPPNCSLQDKKVKARIDARNQLETYCYNMNQVQQCVDFQWFCKKQGCLLLFFGAKFWGAQGSDAQAATT